MKHRNNSWPVGQQPANRGQLDNGLQTKGCTPMECGGGRRLSLPSCWRQCTAPCLPCGFRTGRTWAAQAAAPPHHRCRLRRCRSHRRCCLRRWRHCCCGPRHTHAPLAPDAPRPAAAAARTPPCAWPSGPLGTAWSSLQTAMGVLGGVLRQMLVATPPAAAMDTSAASQQSTRQWPASRLPSGSV